jgi:hypothetical protein
MKRVHSKALIVAATAILAIAVTAGVAFAAPVLQPGVTSAPGMSGVCTDCHTYATAPTTPPVVTPPTNPAPPTAGENEKGDNEKPVVHKAKKAKHHKAAKRHVARARHAERD